MSKLRVISYDQDAMSGAMSEYSSEGGFLGALPSLLPFGEVVGVVSASTDSNLDARFGVPGSSGTRIEYLKSIIECLTKVCPALNVLVQDPWALESDYQQGQLIDKPRIVSDGCVYLPIFDARLSDELASTMRKLVSTRAAVIFTRTMMPHFTTAMLVESSVAAAATAYDGQGWLVWVSKSLLGRGRLPLGNRPAWP